MINCLDLSDAGVTLYSNDHLLVKSPGVAVREGNQIFMGVEAQRRARLLPRQTNSQFWSQLNLEPMQQSLGSWNRHADIAHAHLQAIIEQGGQLEDVILAVPGNYQSDQLALLLGIARECKFNAVGLVDSALAALVNVELYGDYIVHLDLQLHQAVATHFKKSASYLKRVNVEVVPDAGIYNLMDSWARAITRDCIRQTRYDPMHNAQSEQALYNELLGWLSALQETPELSVELQGHLFRINRSQLLSHTEKAYTALRSVLNTQHDQCALGHRMLQLPEVRNLFAGAVELSEKAVATGVLHSAASIRVDGSELSYVTALEQPFTTKIQKGSNRSSKPESSTVNSNDEVTHILWRNIAYPIVFDQTQANESKEFIISTKQQVTSNSLALFDNNTECFQCRLQKNSGITSLYIDDNSQCFFTLYQLSNCKRVGNEIQSGDTLRVGGSKEELTFIRVLQ